MASKSRVLRFALPYGATNPVVVNPELGLDKVVRRGGGHTAATDVTLLDSSDHRLLRAGIVLAHRVSDGLGEWFLDAPGWQPWLPVEMVDQHGAVDELPVEMARLVHPFRRSAPLGPVAALGRRRTGWLLVDAEGGPVARLRDDQITIRRGGITTARYREVTAKLEPSATRAQRQHLCDAMLAIGGARVESFPSLPARIGPPATGLSDFRGPYELREDSTLEAFVGWLFARRLDRVMRADLTLRSGESTDMDLLREQLAGLRGELRSLSFALEPVWRERVEREIDLVLPTLASRSIDQLDEDYFDVIDSLVLGVRAPKLGNLSQHRAVEALDDQVVLGATILFDRAHSLTLASGDDRWAATLTSARQVAAMAHTAALLGEKRARKLEQRLDETISLLGHCQMPPGLDEPHLELDWDAATAFQEGRRFERGRQERMAWRRRFIETWPEVEKRLRKLRRKRPEAPAHGHHEHGQPGHGRRQQ